MEGMKKCSIILLMTFCCAPASTNVSTAFADANPKPGTVLLIDIMLADSFPSIQKVVLQPGAYRDKKQESSSGDDTAYRLVVLGHDGSSLYETEFLFPISITIPLAFPGGAKDKTPSEIPLHNPELTLIVPYYEDADTILIMNPGDPNPAAARSMGDIEDLTREISASAPDSTPAESGKLNILIMASGYGTDNMSKFYSQADKIKNTLMTFAPFSTQATSINIHAYANTMDLECHSGCSGIDRLLCCHSSSVISAASSSGSLFDEIIVVHNTSTYAGGGYREYMDAYKTNSYNSYCAVYDGFYTASMAVHEFGHSFGNLCDEYLYTNEGITYAKCVNCMESCNLFPASSYCQLGCAAKADYYRPDTSIMYSLDKAFFNDASIFADYSPDGLDKRLAFFVRELEMGSLTVTLSPQTAIDAGAQWRVDDGAWQNSGATVQGIPVGPHTLEFNDIVGWTKPATQSVTITTGQTTNASGTYVLQTGSVRVTIAPQGAVDAGAQWRVDDGAWQNSGATVQGIPIGQHTIQFEDIPGWTKPSNQTVAITNRQTMQTSGEYNPLLGLDFTATPTSGKAPLKVTFTCASTGTGTKWFWEFGDGKTSTKQNPVYTYRKPGSYSVMLTVTGPEGSDTVTQDACVNAYALPKAGFTATPRRGFAPLTVGFTDKSKGSITSWEWDFGDGQSSKEQHPVHTYTTAGNFIARLTVTGPVPVGSSTKTQKVSVKAPK
jgi:PKD repeat protein